jgi:hypothetical protein
VCATCSSQNPNGRKPCTEAPDVFFTLAVSPSCVADGVARGCAESHPRSVAGSSVRAAVDGGSSSRWSFRSAQERTEHGARRDQCGARMAGDVSRLRSRRDWNPCRCHTLSPHRAGARPTTRIRRPVSCRGVASGCRALAGRRSRTPPRRPCFLRCAPAASWRVPVSGWRGWPASRWTTGDHADHWVFGW